MCTRARSSPYINKGNYIRISKYFFSPKNRLYFIHDVVVVVHVDDDGDCGCECLFSTNASIVMKRNQ